MASTTTIICPECEKQMKVSAEVIGKKIRCKGCGKVFPAKANAAAGGKAVAKKKAPAKKDDDEEDANPYGITEETFAPRCPQCANEMESREAVICLFCGYNLETREKARMRKIREVTGWDKFKWWLPGILCALAVIIMATGDILYCALVNKESFGGEDVWYSFLGGLAIKMWIVIPTIFLMYYGTKFAIRRLIFNYTVPEVEERF
jgi:DNA-directed RNA polymerase subunit M/transcription elongation factor TFIIS